MFLDLTKKFGKPICVLLYGLFALLAGQKKPLPEPLTGTVSLRAFQNKDEIRDTIKRTMDFKKNLYSTAVPKETTMIIFNNHINGGMPSEPDFDQKKFDAAKQIVDTPSQYQIIGCGIVIRFRNADLSGISLG